MTVVDPTPGAEFAGHLIEAVIGEGGMGVVYRARNLALDQDRALKVLSPALSGDDRFRERFKRESRQAASIEHPNVIPVHQAGEEGGHLYLAMRLVDGLDLRRLVERDGRLEPERAVEIVVAAAAGLEAAHAAGLIHRDVKPANVLVGEGRDAGRTYITDFGISRTVGGGETVTSTGELVGTADFMSPEQVAGDEVDGRGDIYALGAVLHFALTGEPPFHRDNEVATLFAHANAPRPRPSAIANDAPLALDAVVERAMAVQPEQRFQSAAEFGAATQAALGGVAPPAPPSSTAVTKPMRRPGRRISGIVVGGVLAALIAIALIALFTGDAGDEGSPPTGATATATKDEVIALHAPAKAIAVGDERIWVAEHDANKVVAISRVTNSPELDLDVPSPKSIAVGFGSVWVVSGSSDSLYRLDPQEGSRVEIALGDGAKPSDVAVDDQWVWVANAAHSEAVRIDPDLNKVDRDVPLGSEPRAIAAGDGSVWVTLIDQAAVSHIDSDRAERIGGQISVGELPVDIAVGEGGIWVASGQLGTVTELDPTGAVVEDPIDVGAQPRGIAAGLGYVWVALGADDAVAQVDPETRSLIGPPIELAEEPSDLALAADGVWVSTEGAGSAVRLSPR